jgi:hypothetical protein
MGMTVIQIPANCCGDPINKKPEIKPSLIENTTPTKIMYKIVWVGRLRSDNDIFSLEKILVFTINYFNKIIKI